MDKIDTSFLNGKKIAVLMGGWSAEREISLQSGHAVQNALMEMSIDSLPVDLLEPETSEKLLKGFDLVFIALHGRGGEDGFIQSLLEKNNITYTGSNAESCKLTMDKSETKKVLKRNLLPVPESIDLLNQGNLEATIDSLLKNNNQLIQNPFVIKPAREGSSFGISLVMPEEKESLRKAIEEAFYFDDKIILESYVKGIEVTVPILGDKAFQPISITPKEKFYDFNAKYKSTETNYSLNALSISDVNLVKKLSLNAFKSLQCSGWGRVDLIQDAKGDFQLIEVNTSPGLTEKSLVPKSALYEGLSFNNLILKILFLACTSN
jgi:D-alanine-D-alanine ligase|tara:strand:- start:1401 stop:2363 length:963 start_codon:yes stop_codon:yes gene_type:complete